MVSECTVSQVGLDWSNVLVMIGTISVSVGNSPVSQ